MFWTVRRGHERRRFAGEAGQTLVGFALILPILLLLVLGIIDLGKAFGYKNDLTNLANQAARAAAVNDCPGSCSCPPVGTFGTCSSINQWIRYQAPSEELRDGGGSISPPPPPPGVPGAGGLGAGTAITFKFTGTGTADDPNYCVGDPIKATITVTYNFLPFLRNVLAGPSVPITGSATMRLEKDFIRSRPAAMNYSDVTNFQPSVPPVDCPS